MTASQLTHSEQYNLCFLLCHVYILLKLKQIIKESSFTKHVRNLSLDTQIIHGFKTLFK